MTALGSCGGCTLWQGRRKTRQRDEEKCYRQKERIEIKQVQEEQNVKNCETKKIRDNKVKTKQAKYLDKIKENRGITETKKEIRKYKTEKEKSITGINNTKTK